MDVAKPKVVPREEIRAEEGGRGLTDHRRQRISLREAANRLDGVSEGLGPPSSSLSQPEGFSGEQEDHDADKEGNEDGKDSHTDAPEVKETVCRLSYGRGRVLHG